MTAGLTDPLDDVAPPLDLAVQAPPRRARVALIKRLADVVSLPSSRVNGFERAITADLLVEMLRDAGVSEKRRVSQRVAMLTDIPNELVRILIQDTIEVAEPLLAEAHISDSELIACAGVTTPEHRVAIARRREVAELVVDALTQFAERPVLEVLLRNTGARFTPAALEHVMAESLSLIHI